MIRSAPALAAIMLWAHTPLPVAAQQPRDLILATTTSTQDSGLLDSILPVFFDQTRIRVKVIAVGTGAALEMARRGDADAVLVHAPAAERKYVDAGDLVEGRLVMHNDFLIVGPAADPAGIRGLADPARALARIARTGPFIARGDGSGTEKKELELWNRAGVDPATVAHREETGQGMGATLLVAEQRQGYTLTDRATYLALGARLTLVPLVEGAPSLLNVYHAYVVNPSRHPGVRLPEARAFVAFMVAPATQRLIRDFGRARFGQPLFYPDAGKDEAALGRPASSRERSGAGVR
ncbi:MAG TPA: substrate-binding domain-containing protein [Gemmatimonadales bacterium]|nr:substrate-binding domain-containing protein [Gemmatimonadales bacterium]